MIECRGTFVLVWNCSEYLFDDACVVTAGMEHFNADCVAAKTGVHANVWQLAFL